MRKLGYEQIGRLKMELEWLKKKLDKTVAEKRHLIDQEHEIINIRRQCELVGLNWSTYHYKPAKALELNLELMRRIDELYMEAPEYGYRTMTELLQRQGYQVNGTRILRLMQLMGIQAVYPKPKTSKRHLTSTRFYQHDPQSGWIVRFLREPDGCATCPLIQHCYKSPKKQTKRDVFISDHFVYFALAVLYMTSEDFRHEMRQRDHVERIIAALVRHNDARRARGRGTAAADFQVKMAAAYNTKKLLRKIQLDPLLG